VKTRCNMVNKNIAVIRRPSVETAAAPLALGRLEAQTGYLAVFADDLDRYSRTKGALRFPVDNPLPKALVKKLIAVRQRQLATP